MFKTAYYTSLLLVIVVNFQCSPYKNEIIKFKYDEFGHTIIPISIGGKSIEGTFDSGSSCSYINEGDLSAIGLRSYGDSTFVISPNFDTIPIKRPKTDAIHFNVGNAKARRKITFSVNSDNFQNRIWGNDVIDQFFWKFNFQKMEATISNRPIKIDTTNCIAIHYEKYDDINLNICSLYLGDENIKVDSLLIDTGGGIVRHLDKKYPIFLNLYYSQQIIDSLNKKYSRLNNDKSLSTDLPFKKLGESTPAFYTGMIRIMNNKKIDININGILILGNIGHFSQMYFDTENQIIYLKK